MKEKEKLYKSIEDIYEPLWRTKINLERIINFIDSLSTQYLSNEVKLDRFIATQMLKEIALENDILIDGVLWASYKVDEYQLKRDGDE